MDIGRAFAETDGALLERARQVRSAAQLLRARARRAGRRAFVIGSASQRHETIEAVAGTLPLPVPAPLLKGLPSARFVRIPGCREDELVRCEMRRLAHAVVVTVRGEIDSSNVHMFEDIVNHSLSDGLPLIADLREVSYIDGSGLHTLVRAHERRTSRETPLMLVYTSEIITRLVSILSLGDMFRTFPDVDAALAHLSNGST